MKSPSSGGGIRTVLPADEKVTDVQKAEWNSPKRPFYELDATITASIIELCQANLNAYVIETNR